MNRLSLVLSKMIMIFKHSRKQPLIGFLLLALTVGTLKQEIDMVLDTINIFRGKEVIEFKKQDMSNLMYKTGSNIVAVYKFNYIVPQTMSETDNVSNGVNIEHIKKKDIPIKEHAEMIVDLYSDECFEGGLSSSTGFSEYIRQGVKHVVACPIKGIENELLGFTIVMFISCPNDIEEVMSQITTFNKNRSNR